MGFFKRLLSSRSKKSKKASSTKEARDLRRFESQPLPVLSEVESEAAANRLLRSASSRLGAIHYNTGDDPLPPLPNRECTLPLPRIFLKALLVKLTPNSTRTRLRLVHYHSFLTVSRFLAGTPSFIHDPSAHPLVSPIEPSSPTAFSPRKQSPP